VSRYLFLGLQLLQHSLIAVRSSKYLKSQTSRQGSHIEYKWFHCILHLCSGWQWLNLFKNWSEYFRQCKHLRNLYSWSCTWYALHIPYCTNCWRNSRSHQLFTLWHLNRDMRIISVDVKLSSQLQLTLFHNSCAVESATIDAWSSYLQHLSTWCIKLPSIHNLRSGLAKFQE
jgi:hypothetical protein